MELKLMSGTGNTFILANLMTESAKEELLSYFPNKSLSDIATKLCKHPLIETDGAVFVLPSEKFAFKWLFFNNDGSEAEMCGNAARCVTLYAHDEKIITNNCEFETLAGTIKGEILGETETRVQMPALRDTQLGQSLQEDNMYTKFDYIDSGVPHCVIKVDSLDNLEEHRSLAVQLRKPQYFAPRGANITFKVPLSKDHIESVSFERGVEDFTEACGTGAVAAAFSHAKENGDLLKVQVNVPGGELSVEFIDGFPYLSGAVNYMGNIKIEELKGETEDER